MIELTSEQRRRIIATHESGHAVAFTKLGFKVTSVTLCDWRGHGLTYPRPDAALVLKRQRLSLRSLQLVIKHSAAIHAIAELLFERGEFGDVDMPASTIIKRHLRMLPPGERPPSVKKPTLQ